MAELLVRAADTVHPDKVKDRVGCYKRGDIVSVFEDGGIDGQKMGLPHFWVIRIPGVPAEALRELRDEQTEDDSGNPFHTGIGTTDPQPATYRRRRYGLHLPSMTARMRSRIDQDGAITLTQTQVLRFMRRKRDGQKVEQIRQTRR